MGLSGLALAADGRALVADFSGEASCVFPATRGVIYAVEFDGTCSVFRDYRLPAQPAGPVGASRAEITDRTGTRSPTSWVNRPGDARHEGLPLAEQTDAGRSTPVTPGRGDYST